VLASVPDVSSKGKSNGEALAKEKKQEPGKALTKERAKAGKSWCREKSKS